MRVLGLMSGTSADGIDAALVQITGDPIRPTWHILKTASVHYPSDISQFIIRAGQGCEFSSQVWVEYAEKITELNYQVALACDPTSQADLVGCHGQTIFHRPPIGDSRGASWQLIQAPLLSTLLKCPVIYDFRSADIALGGNGAPLVPLVDEALIGRSKGWRALLNLGGIANLTLIPPKLGPDKFSPVIGWDCGPANTLIDLAVQKSSNGQLQFDRGGLIALAGIPRQEIIKVWLKEPYFQRKYPKSTGREQYGVDDLNQRLLDLSNISQEDIIATLTSFSASVIAQDLDFLYSREGIKPIEMFVAGGGAENKTMLKEIRNLCSGIKVAKIEEIGIPSKMREALAFALLAWWQVIKKTGTSPSITGAKKASVLGVKVNPAGENYFF